MNEGGELSSLNIDNEIVNKLYELIIGEDGFLVRLRCENQFPNDMYMRIIDIIKTLVNIWSHQEEIPRKGFIAICYLMAELSGGNRFLSESDSLKVEDAYIEVMEILTALE